MLQADSRNFRDLSLLGGMGRVEAGCASGHLLCLSGETDKPGGGCLLLEPLSLGETGVISP